MAHGIRADSDDLYVRITGKLDAADEGDEFVQLLTVDEALDLIDQLAEALRHQSQEVRAQTRTVRRKPTDPVSG
jgi:hypothetical protein